MGETDSRRLRAKMWSVVKILNVRLRFVLLMVVVGLIAAHWDTIAAHLERWTQPHHAAVEAESRYEYYCPMHPSVVRGEPGNCPICGMPLVARVKGEALALPEGVVGRVQFSPEQIQLAGIGTSEVDCQPFGGTIRTLGTLAVDERRIAHISSRVAGRIEKLYADLTGGSIAKGAPLAEIYSPDLVSTQQEYLLARQSLDRLQGSGTPQAVAQAKELLAATRQRLLLWGITENQIDDIGTEGAPQLRVQVYAPIGGVVTQKEVLEGQYVMEGSGLYTVADLSNVWLTAFVYEDDIDRIEVGQPVQVTTSALPGRSFAGKISFIWPTLDQATRTLQLRVDIPNPKLELRPGMYATAVIETRQDSSPLNAASAQDPAERYICPMDADVVSSQPGNCPLCGMVLEKAASLPPGHALAVPETAVIDTGTRKVVYLEREPGVFDAVEVELGPLAAGFYPVIKGLSQGQRVVTQGAFLVDAELRLNPGAAGSYFGASGGPSNGSAQSNGRRD